MYFDYAATTPPDAEVLKTYETVSRDFWANPKALHRPGVRAELMLEQARLQVLHLLGAEPEYRCLFTSGATESCNTAIKGLAAAGRPRGRHLISAVNEHPAVLEACRHLERYGYELTLLPVGAEGRVDPDALSASLRPDTVLVSLMHVNNETGAINDIMELARRVKAVGHALFHVDAAQSAGKLPLQLNGSGIDALSLSAHKFYGLKGSGALLLRSGLRPEPLLHGGGQEGGLRSGTGDPARAAALAKALRLALEEAETKQHHAALHKERIAETLLALPDIELNGCLLSDSPYILNISVGGIMPETLLQALAEQDLFISTVSACASRKVVESTPVLAMTGSHERAQHSIRISLADRTTKEEVDALCRTVGPVIESLRLRSRPES